MEQLEIDARGQACPLPVARAKKALDMIDTGNIRVLVDNDTAVHNLENLAKSQGCTSSSEQRSEEEFVVVIEKVVAGEQDDATEADQTCFSCMGDRVVVISSSTMGTGDDELGTKLMRGFIFALAQLDVLPQTILFYNSGVFLTCEGSATLADLEALADAGVEILSCGTCLDFYDLTKKLAVGDVTNMYVIAEKQMKASLIIRP